MTPTPHRIELPALLADSPLGFLAALGILELTTHTLDPHARLSWAGPAQPAVLHTTHVSSVEDLADHLRTQLPEDPDTEPFPLAPGVLSRERHPAPGSPIEPLRMPIDEAHRQLATYAQAERETGAPTPAGSPHWSTSSTPRSRTASATPPSPRSSPHPAA